MENEAPTRPGDVYPRFLTPRTRGPAARLAGDGSRSPASAFMVALLAAFVLAAALSVALGRIVTDVLLNGGGVQAWDQGAVETFVDHRSDLLDSVSEVGSFAGSFFVTGLALLVAAAFAFRRKWRAAAFAAFLPPVESGLYRLTSLADPRQRPDVPRLEDLPVDASYPSGHTGVTVAVCFGLALLLTPYVRGRAARAAIWLPAVALPVFVAASRIYRGMHHPIDAAAGLLVGLMTIAVVAFACRAAGAAVERRRGVSADSALPPPPPPPPPAESRGVAEPLVNTLPPPPPPERGDAPAASGDLTRRDAGEQRDGPDLPEGVEDAKEQGEKVQRTKGFERFARFGLVSRGAVYALIGVLALGLALGLGGATTSQQGALREIAQQPLGTVLLALTAIGLAGYASWRLLRAAIGHGTEDDDSTFDRIGGLVSGIGYALLCATAIQILLGSGGGGGGASQTTGGVLSWTGGVWIVGAAGIFTMGEGLDQAYKGFKKKFLEKSKTEEMSEKVKSAFTKAGVIGHVARAVVFLLIGYFLLRAAIDYNPDAAVTLDGALTKIANVDYGKFLLGIVAAGLLAFGAYSMLDARYRKV